MALRESPVASDDPAESAIAAERRAVLLDAVRELVYVDRQGTHHAETARLAGPTLVWSDGRVTYRLEGVPDLTEAVAIAVSVS